ncbi:MULTISPECIES: class A beta-lactamase, subclass A2 [unclassified Chryseobacterium]|uniref:class A beta-lactamase, subclass A2 n=1 Tax=unclassified Chryseobacterium TaxID=2593645 RepID=UPI00100B8DDD|nr:MULTISPECIES: class A beta-lactamase, subclass A2 [unclassified Chryseobacterium]RXM51156.1 class A beta-lactamase [Chryseobacterium sp. CH25]RXM64767.1 class A beta-lactamase [Chryseobacterium sp. CH1]
MKKASLFISICLFSIQLKSQTMQDLRSKINTIISTKNATVGISVKGIEDKDTLSINGNKEMPMLSVFKFHIALSVLNQVDKGKLKLNQKFFIKKEELLPETWSPIREEYPEGNMYLTLDQLLRYTVSHSDNNGCDILLRIVGGAPVVQKFINQQGIKDFTIRLNEQQMNTFESYFVNTSTPLATTDLLEKFYKGKVLKKETTKYLYQIMVETSRGLTWMKAGLPAGTELAHRTGISGRNEQNIRAAMNDVGIIKLPNGKHVILSVYLKNINEEMKDTEKIIADIGTAVWEYYVSKP